MNSWAEISELSLTENYRALRRTAGPDIDVLAVIKANAYGHSAQLCAPILSRAGSAWLGVTDAPEGVRVRQALASANIAVVHQPELLVMCGPAPEDAAELIQHRLTPAVWDADQIQVLARAQARISSSEPLPIHLEIDSGMSRQGVAPGPALARTLAALEMAKAHVRVTGVFTHFSSAEVAVAPETAKQLASFRAVLTTLVSAGLRPDWLHVGNSSTLDNRDLLPDRGTERDPFAWFRDAARSLGARPMLRSGLALFGYCLATSAPRLAQHLAPVLSWHTRIRSLTEIPTGAAVGYNGTQHATRATRLALLPVGYADGFRREMSSADGAPGGWVTVRGRRAPIVGRVSMNLTTVDVTDIPDAETGDTVVLLGPGISAQDHASLAHTIPYEILCGLRPDTRRLVAGDVVEPAFAQAATTPVASG